MKHTARNQQRRSPFGEFANYVDVRPTCTEVSLRMGHYHAGDQETIEWRVDEIARFTMPYAAAKVTVFNLMASIVAAEHGAGFINVPVGIRPQIPSAEYIGAEGVAKLTALFNELFAPAIALVGPASGESESPAKAKTH